MSKKDRSGVKKRSIWSQKKINHVSKEWLIGWQKGIYQAGKKSDQPDIKKNSRRRPGTIVDRALKKSFTRCQKQNRRGVKKMTAQMSKKWLTGW